MQGPPVGRPGVGGGLGHPHGWAPLEHTVGDALGQRPGNRRHREARGQSPVGYAALLVILIQESLAAASMRASGAGRRFDAGLRNYSAWPGIGVRPDVESVCGLEENSQYSTVALTAREVTTRVILAHVRYRQYGGEDAVFAHELGLLRNAGVTVEPLELRSADLGSLPLASKVGLLARYANHAYGKRIVRSAVERFHPDLIHFHNLYPLLGPGAISEAHSLKCATVHTLHNFRLSCLNGLHYRKQAICELCRPTRFLPGVRHACYRASRLQSVLTAQAASAQWRAYQKSDRPTLLFALTAFARDKYVEYGADPGRIVVKPNSVLPHQEHVADSSGQRTGAIVAGRLTQEKGIIQLMNAWSERLPPLTVIGDGPLASEAAVRVGQNVIYLGRLSHADVRLQLRKARVLALPSLCYEAMPLIVLEALSEGLPVVAFSGGALDSMELPSTAGACAARGDFEALARAAARVALDSDWQEMSAQCHSIWRTTYSDEVNIRSLLRHYSHALALNANTCRVT